MAVDKITAAERERYARAREAGLREARDPSSARAATYIGRGDLVKLEFRGGGAISVPRRLISELAIASPSDLRSLTVSVAGDALECRPLDVDIYIPGLVERVFGTRMFAASSGRRGGQRTSKVKAAAARRNGAKGGRPRKRATA